MKNRGEIYDALQVKMLGTFSVTWQGVELIDVRQSSSQFGFLLQALFRFRESGVSKTLMKEVLFEGRDIEDAQHAMRNVIYNAKRRLKAAGLPDVNYITLRQGSYFWTDQIPLKTDIGQMESLYAEAEGLKDPEAKLAKYEAACYLYRGGFLERVNTEVWAVQEERHYQALFRECVEKAMAIQREKKMFRQMKKLSEHASGVDSFAEWEVREVEALVGLGRYEEAQKLCDSTIDHYIEEYGQRTSSYVRELANRLSAEMFHQYESLEEIQNKLLDQTSGGSGGYFCSYPVFQEVYRTVARMMERHGDMVFLMLCTVVDGKGNPMREGQRLEDLSERLLQSIIKSVRRSDTVTKYGKGQYLVLLANTTKENCEIVQKRIGTNFQVGRQRTSVEFFVNSVIVTSF